MYAWGDNNWYYSAWTAMGTAVAAWTGFFIAYIPPMGEK